MADEPAGGVLRRAWHRIEVLPTWVFLSWVSALLVLRAGVGWSEMEELQGFARDFPQPGGTFRSNSVLGPTLAWATGLDSRTRWLWLHAGLVCCWFTLVLWLLRRRLGSGAAWRVAAVWFSFASTPVVLLRNLGSYDVFTAIGVALVALGGSPWLAALGGAVMGATNAEQGLLAVICGALVAWAVPAADGEQTRPRATVLLVVASTAGLVVARAVVVIWFARLDASVPGRGDVFEGMLSDSLRNALSLGTAGIYAWLGAGWVITIITVWRLRTHPGRWTAASAGLVLMPAAATVATLDGTRVFAAVGGVALLVALVWFARLSERAEGGWVLSCSAALMLFGWVLPAIVTSYRGGVKVPWGFVVGVLVERS